MWDYLLGLSNLACTALCLTAKEIIIIALCFFFFFFANFYLHYIHLCFLPCFFFFWELLFTLYTLAFLALFFLLFGNFYLHCTLVLFCLFSLIFWESIIHTWACFVWLFFSLFFFSSLVYRMFVQFDCWPPWNWRKQVPSHKWTLQVRQPCLLIATRFPAFFLPRRHHLHCLAYFPGIFCLWWRGMVAGRWQWPCGGLTRSAPLWVAFD